MLSGYEFKDSPQLAEDRKAAIPQLTAQARSTAIHSIARAREELKLRAARQAWMDDPVLWAKERLGIHLWSLQREIAMSVKDNKKTIVKSCHDSGKTFLAAVLVCWWIDTRPDDQTMVVSTAPTAYQVNKLLWEYIRQIHNKHKLSGVVSEASEWKSEGNRYTVAYGRKPADTNLHGFQGMHRRYVLVILDEACGIPQSIWTGVDTITTNPDNRILAIGNPDDPATEFGRIFDPKNEKTTGYGWNKFTISAFDTPNFTEEKYELPEGMAEMLLDPKWVEDKAKRWGVNSSRYIAKVRAEFPEESFDTLFPPKVLTEALDRDLYELRLVEDDAPVVLGVDVARFGGDLTTVVSNHGGVIRVLGAWSKADTVESAQQINRLAALSAANEVRVDGTGLGAGVVDQLRRLCGHRYVVVEMVGSERSPDNTRWINARAYWHDTLLHKLRNGVIDLPQYLNDDEDAARLYADLEVIRYLFKKGALQVESKDEIRKRLKKSPDFSDAVVYATAEVDLNALSAQLAPNERLYVDPMAEYIGRGYAVSPY